MRKLLFVVITVFVSGQLLAGSYSNNFDSATHESTDLGDGSIFAGGQARAWNPGGTDGFVILNQDFAGGAVGNFVLPTLDPSFAITGFTASFDSYLANTSGLAADGFSFNMGGITTGSLPYGGEYSMYNSLPMVSVGFDTYDNRAIRVLVNGILVGENTTVLPIVDENWRNVTITMDDNGLDVSYGGTAVFTDLDVSGYVPQVGDRFAFAGRTGSEYEDAFIDNVFIVTVPEPASVLLVIGGFGFFGLAQLIRRYYKPADVRNKA